MLSALLLLTGLPVFAEAAPEISAYAAVLYDPLTETVLYERNSREILPMASTVVAVSNSGVSACTAAVSAVLPPTASSRSDRPNAGGSAVVMTSERRTASP